jgi:hypothetical protein
MDMQGTRRLKGLDCLGGDAECGDHLWKGETLREKARRLLSLVKMRGTHRILMTGMCHYWGSF